MVEARISDGSLERVKDEIDLEIEGKIVSLQVSNEHFPTDP